MAWFGIKKDQGDPAPVAASAGAQPVFAPQPDKAAKFFSHARTVDETGNYEYAVQSWLQGLRQDWTSVPGLEGFFGSIAKYLGESGGKARISKEVHNAVEGRSEVDRYLGALLEWGLKPNEPTLAVRALEAAGRLNLVDPGRWIGERALGWVMGAKPRKDLLLKCADSLEKLGILDRAITAAEAALKLDQSDGPLAARIRNMAAHATMTRGGYDQAGQSGGFRQNIRDQAKQRQLEDAERIGKTADAVDRLVAAAEEEYAKRPTDVPTIEVLCKRLVERGRPEDEERAHQILMGTHETTRQFRFRELAGDLLIRQARRRARALEEPARQDPEKQGEFAAAMKALGELEVAEFRLRVEAYPTDLERKYKLGERLFLTQKFEDAIPMFQEAQHDPRYRARSLGMLAECFLAMDWAGEAIETFRHALETRDLLPEQQLDLNYGLMKALQGKATAERDAQAAEEAERIASSIAIKQLTYKDIRARRESLKKLVAELKAPRPGGTA